MDVKENPFTGGTYCVFQKGEDFFYADRSFTCDHGLETMIFPCDKEGIVTDWDDVYCDNSGKSLMDCIEEFLSE